MFIDCAIDSNAEEVMISEKNNIVRNWYEVILFTFMDGENYVTGLCFYLT